MEKRLLIAIALSALVLLIYYATMEPALHPSAPPAGTGSEVKSVEKEGEEVGKEPAAEVPFSEKISTVPLAVGGEDVVVETSLYRIILTTRGARIKSFRLKNYHEMWKSEKELEKEINAIEKKLSREKDESLLRSKEILLYMDEEGKRRRNRIKELEVEIEEMRQRENYRSGNKIEEELKVEKGVELIPASALLYGNYPLTLNFPNLSMDFNTMLFECDVDRLNLCSGGKAAVVFEAESNGVRVKKIFDFSEGDYAIGLRLMVENNSTDTIRDEKAMLEYGPGLGFAKEVQVRGATKRVASYMGGMAKARFETVEGRRATIPPNTSARRIGDVEWAALRNKYFAAIIVPLQKCSAIRMENIGGGEQRVGVKIPPFSLENGEEMSSDFKIYLGPQKVEELRKVRESLEKIIDYGFWEPIAKAIAFLLKEISDVVKNYGWSIVLLSLFIKVIFYPLTHRSFEGMHKMQADMKILQPKMEALKQKYGNSQQKLNKAMMELYRKEGINPLSGCKSGCLPMLLQMPVFFALYVVLYNCIDLRGAHFLGWITDLSAPDPWKVLPILMGVSMFWQQKQTGMGDTSMSATSKQQQDQAKMMKWMMPAVLTFVFFSLPAGVVLYWFSFNIFTGLQQFLIMKKKEKGTGESAEAGKKNG